MPVPKVDFGIELKCNGEGTGWKWDEKKKKGKKHTQLGADGAM